MLVFYSTLQSNCLGDEPVRVSSLRFPDKLPGQIFDADTQCKWQFGQHARLCIFEFGKVLNSSEEYLTFISFRTEIKEGFLRGWFKKSWLLISFTLQREVCQKLWCYKGGQMCETKFLPAADGTSCGHGMVGRHNFICKNTAPQTGLEFHQKLCATASELIEYPVKWKIHVLVTLFWKTAWSFECNIYVLVKCFLSNKTTVLHGPYQWN